MKQLLNKEEVRTWFAQHEPDAIVGTADKVECCPLARYLKHKTCQVWQVSEVLYNLKPVEGSLGEEDDDRDMCTTFIRGHSHNDLATRPPFETPDWAQEFIAVVDAAGEYEPSISADLALEILDSLECNASSTHD